MVYLQNTTESQDLFVPKRGAVPQGNLVFQAWSTIDLETKVNQAVTDLLSSKMYFKFAIALPAGIPDGEYQYSVKVGEAQTEIACGLLVVGGYAKPKEHETEKSYEQYDPRK